MSTLSRYQKSGGFNQLLQLIETCGKQKQDSFLQMIEKEDPNWAKAIREKMLTIDKILGWNDTVLAEIVARLQTLTLATALHSFKPEDKERLLKTFTHAQKRTIDDLFRTKEPSAAEISSAYLKILQEVRSMIINNYIRLDKFAPEMVVPKDFEDTLGKSPSAQNTASTNHDPGDPVSQSYLDNLGTPHGHDAKTDGKQDNDLNTLRTRLHSVTNENNQLKNEVKVLRDKLAQIKRIA